MADTKYQTPRVPIQTPFFDQNGQLTRTWIIFFERLGRVSAEGITQEILTTVAALAPHVIGWDVQDATAGSDVSDPVIPIADGTVAHCLLRIKVTDMSNTLKIDIRNNGTSIFAAGTQPTLAPGSNGRDVYDFPTATTLISVNDDPVLDIITGGTWQFAVYLPYEAPKTGVAFDARGHGRAIFAGHT